MRKAILLLLLLLPACHTTPSGPVTLFDFEDEKELDLLKWRCRDRFTLSSDWAASGTHSLRCEAAHRTYPGVILRPPLLDWAPYRSLSLHVYSAAADTVTLVVRIDDERAGPEYGDRYNGYFPIHPGENSIEVDLEQVRRSPARRELDLSRLDRVLLFLRKPDETPVLYFDGIALR